MAKQTSMQDCIVATLKFEDPVVFDTDALHRELGGMFRDVDLDLTAGPATGRSMTFSGAAMLVDVSKGDDAITVSVSATGSNDVQPARAGQARRAACYNIVRTLQTRLAPISVNWSDAEMAAADATSRKRHLKKQCEAPSGLSPKERMNQIFGTVEGEGSHSDCNSLTVSRTLKRLDQSFEAVKGELPVPSDLAELGYSEPRTRLASNDPHRFPDLMPVEIALREDRRTLFACDAIELTQSSVQDETTNPSERIEADDIMARLTVYVLNTILLVLAFPVGFGMLIFNILGGENLRTTAHVMALTGMGTALAAANVELPFLSMI